MRLPIAILSIVSLTALSLLPQSGCASKTKVLAVSQENAKLLDRLQDYPDLESLSITCLEALPSLPDSIGGLSKLRELKIDNGNGCSMNPVLPEAIGNLRSLQTLVLVGAQDPRGAGNDHGPQPAARHSFPQSMSQLKSLTHLDLGRNGFNEVPQFVKDLPNLQELGLEWNVEIRKLPEFLSKLRELNTLMLEGNDLDDLPACLNELPKLTRITLGNNCRITQSPTAIQSLKHRFPKVNFDFADEYDCPEK